MPESKNSNQIHPNEAEKRVSEAVADVVEDDSLLIEEDGDFFWVLQKVVWGVIKTLFILGVIGLVIWFIWRDSDPAENTEVIEPATRVSTEEKPGFFQRLFGNSDTKDSKENTASSPAEKPATTPTPTQAPINNTPPTPTKTNTDDIYEAARWAYNLEYDRSNQSGSILSESIRWLKNAKTIGEVSEGYLRSQNPAERTLKIQEVIAEGDKLMQQYDFLNQALAQEYEVYLARGNAANNRVKALDEQILENIKTFQSVGIDDLITQKVEAQRLAAANLSNAKIRETLQKNMQQFAALLQQKMLPLFARPTELRSSGR